MNSTTPLFAAQVVTLFPDEVARVGAYGVVGRAVQDGKVALGTQSPRAFAEDRHRTVDDRPFGGGPGMVATYAPWVAAIRAAKAALPRAKVVMMSPQGAPLTQQRLASMATEPGVILVAGRYEGIDERIVDAEIDEELSLGDFVLSGGELAAMAILDGVVRLLPGVLGHSQSAAQDSFSEGLLDCPHYTRPDVAEGRTVPDVLMSGDHAAIARWRRQQMLGRTWQRRPELIDRATLNDEDRVLLEAFLASCNDAVDE
ncbi:MAG: tRNA (guanosine(37)-N1)-methyltransferase TrmD [Pseudomonadota bacterium]